MFDRDRAAIRCAGCTKLVGIALAIFVSSIVYVLCEPFKVDEADAEAMAGVHVFCPLPVRQVQKHQRSHKREATKSAPYKRTTPEDHQAMEGAGVEGYRPGDWNPEETRQLDELVKQLGERPKPSACFRSRPLVAAVEGTASSSCCISVLHFVQALSALQH